MRARLLFLALVAAFGCGGKTTSPEVGNTTDEAAIVKPPCEQPAYDVFAGTINGVPATASQEQVQAALPCSSGSSEDGGDFNYGGGVFYVDHDFYFYTGNDFVEVRSSFAGSVTPPLLGARAQDVIDQVGTPVMRDDQTILVEHAPGCIRAGLENDLVTSVESYFRTCEAAAALNVEENEHF